MNLGLAIILWVSALICGCIWGYWVCHKTMMGRINRLENVVGRVMDDQDDLRVSLREIRGEIIRGVTGQQGERGEGYRTEEGGRERTAPPPERTKPDEKSKPKRWIEFNSEDKN